MFDIMTSVEDEESGEINEEILEDYIDAITQEFSESPEFLEMSDEPQIRYLFHYLDYAASYTGDTVGTMTRGTNEEVLFELFPRKFTMEASDGPVVISEIRAFWKFIDRTRSLPIAGEIIARLDKDSEKELEELLGDESNFGMAKSFFAAGKQRGFDMTTQSGMNQFMEYYNHTLANQNAPKRHVQTVEDADAFRDSYDYAETIRNDEPRVGRNDPCTCGSGKKFKKCCGKNG